MPDKKKKKGAAGELIILVLGLVMIFGGAAMFFFPKLTNTVYEHEIKSEQKQFEAQMAQYIATDESGEAIPDPKLEELYAELQRRNESMYYNHQANLTDPLSYEQVWVDLTEYGLKDNTIGYISIEKMDVVLPILLGATTENMKHGAVHLTETSYPIGGNNTNCVIAAHRGSSVHEMFRNIDRLELGDIIEIKNFRETLKYKVAEIKIITPTEIDQIYIQEGRDMVTLLTCHPLGQNFQRYVVYCERTEN